jgi:hypothetical protein
MRRSEGRRCRHEELVLLYYNCICDNHDKRDKRDENPINRDVT